MASSRSLLHRVAWSAAIAASVAALLAAVATIVLASYLLNRAEDRRVEDAAVTFADELDHASTDRAAVQQVHHDESEEMAHSGLSFAVYDRDGQLLAGDARLELSRTLGCSTTPTALRSCRVQTSSGLGAVAGVPHVTFLPLLASAAIAATLLSAVLAWLASRPIARFVVGPLTRLRERIAELDVDTTSHAELGPPEQVVEVDALSNTIAQLIVRIERAIALAHRFAANAAHELRTPLTAVQAELELLSESIAEPEARANAQRAQRKLVELVELVERLLVLSVPARTASDAHEVVSLRDLLEDSVAALPVAQQKRITLPVNDALVRGDALLLGTMIANALSNALKFADKASVSMSTIDAELVLHIEDDGQGMDAADRERVFEPFFRADTVLRQRLPGHGLGLALIRHIAQTHGGLAAFVDMRERGSCLEIRLPLHTPTQPLRRHEA